MGGLFPKPLQHIYEEFIAGIISTQLAKNLVTLKTLQLKFGLWSILFKMNETQKNNFYTQDVKYGGHLTQNYEGMSNNILQ